MNITPAQWQNALHAVHARVGDAEFVAWFDAMAPSTAPAPSGHMNIDVPTPFFGEYLKNTHKPALEEALTTELCQPVQVVFTVNEQVMAQKAAEATPAVPEGLEMLAPKAPMPDSKLGSQLNPHYRFESFVMGKSNQLAFAGAQRVAEQPGSFNPLVLHGGVGLGKTHLMHSIGHTLRQSKPHLNIAYLSAEQFVQQFVGALRARTALDFKQAFRDLDVLMVDDIQFIAGKESSQEEFFHTFNTLVQSGKQVIVTTDRSPHELDKLDDRLRSRLGQGLTAEVHPPELETRMAILTKKCEERNLAIPENVITYIANGIAGNVRELEGALNRLAAASELLGATIDYDFALDQLKDIFRASNRLVTVEDIQKKVCEHFNIRVSDLLSASRRRDIARPRQMAMYLCKTQTSKSYPEIGRHFNGRDHTTIMHGIKTIEKLMETDAEIRERIKLLERLVSQ